MIGLFYVSTVSYEIPVILFFAMDWTEWHCDYISYAHFSLKSHIYCQNKCLRYFITQ